MGKKHVRTSHFAPSKLPRHLSPVTANNTIDNQKYCMSIHERTHHHQCTSLAQKIIPESHAAFRSNNQLKGKTQDKGIC